MSARTIVGQSTSLLRVLQIADRVALTDATVLITGESGTGKEMLARRIHHRSKRCARNLVTLNCAAIPQEIIESELFGHVKGAFTSALQAREGRFQLAHGGTLFLDEIGDMSMTLQPKLLRVLQEKTFEPVGSSVSLTTDVRVIAATNQDLRAACRERRFREDLFFRLNVVPIRLPALRERLDDIPALASFFLHLAAQEYDVKAPMLTEPALKVMREYPWPGNVRELENVMRRAVLLTTDEITDQEVVEYLGGPSTVVQEAPGGLREQSDAHQRQIIQEALQKTAGNKTKAAAVLGVQRTTLIERMRRLGILYFAAKDGAD